MDYREAEAFDEKYGLANFVPTKDFKAMPQAEALTGFTGSLTWFIRKHKARLVKAGALWPKQGPGGFLIHPDNMEREAKAIVADEYQEAVAKVLESEGKS